MKLLILIMALLANGKTLVPDGDPSLCDQAFFRVDTRNPAHLLPAGVAADAVNMRFEGGKFRPRYSVMQQAWGKLSSNARTFNNCGYSRFSDPSGVLVSVLLTDDWRDGIGEDGGRGRAWRIISGNAPMQIPMNGHDIYGQARQVPCKSALVMLRQDNERHYFSAANNPFPAAGTIQLNCTPAWQSGDSCLFWADATVNSGLSGGAAPAPQSQVFVKNIGNNQVELYADAALTAKYAFTAGVGRFYIERQAVAPGFFGNGAPPLIAQPDVLGNSLFDIGFVAIPVDVFATAISADNKTLTAPNHRMIPGDSVNYVHAGVATALFVNPINDYQLTFFDTQTHALLALKNGSTSGQQTLTFSAGDYVVKTGAGALPAPPAREGFYAEGVNRLVLVNGKNNIWISDPLDPLHGSPFVSSLTANLGEADSVVAVTSLSSSDTLVFLKQRSVLALFNLSGGSSQWALRSVTREYGCESSLSVVPWGSSIYFLSRRGLDRVEFNILGGTVVPGQRSVSDDVKKYTDLIDWPNASMTVCETWNNRLFMAFPSKGQRPGPVVNDTVLALNFLNSNPTEHLFGWEGAWTGAHLKVYAFARADVFGEDRLTFGDFNGDVNWFYDGVLDFGNAPISTSLTTRVYSGGTKGRKIWQSVLVNWETWNPKIGVAAKVPGYNETTTLAANFTYDRTKYAAGESADYNPATQQPAFGNPYRDDYSFGALAEVVGNPADAYQDHTEPFLMREDDWGVQITISCTQGACRVQSVEVGGFVGPRSEHATV